MLDLKQFSTANFKVNGKRPPENDATKRSTALFFAFHYGFFHLGYLIFLFAEQGFEGNWIVFWICVLVFYLNHNYSYAHNREHDQSRKPNIGVIMFFPYLRIIPMHLTIVIGGTIAPASNGVLLMFLGLKTLADVAMHKIEHARWRK